MPPVCVDTSVLLPGLLGRGRRNAFLFLLAYGAAHARLDALTAERIELEQIAAEGGAEAHFERYDELIDRAQRRIARVEEFQLVGMPADVVLCCSLDLIDEYVAKLVEVGPRIDPDAGLVNGTFWRRLLLALIADYWPARFGELPRYVDDDPDDDKVVHTALVTSADWLVSDDAHIVPDAAESIEYQLPDQTARIAAARFDYYVAEQVETDGLDLSDIDGSWLWSLLRPLDHEA